MSDQLEYFENAKHTEKETHLIPLRDEQASIRQRKAKVNNKQMGEKMKLVHQPLKIMKIMKKKKKNEMGMLVVICDDQEDFV